MTTPVPAEPVVVINPEEVEFMFGGGAGASARRRARDQLKAVRADLAIKLKGIKALPWIVNVCDAVSVPLSDAMAKLMEVKNAAHPDGKMPGKEWEEVYALDPRAFEVVHGRCSEPEAWATVNAEYAVAAANAVPVLLNALEVAERGLTGLAQIHRDLERRFQASERHAKMLQIQLDAQVPVLLEAVKENLARAVRAELIVAWFRARHAAEQAHYPYAGLDFEAAKVRLTKASSLLEEANIPLAEALGETSAPKTEAPDNLIYKIIVERDNYEALADYWHAHSNYVQASGNSALAGEGIDEDFDDTDGTPEEQLEAATVVLDKAITRLKWLNIEVPKP